MAVENGGAGAVAPAGAAGDQSGQQQQQQTPAGGSNTPVAGAAGGAPAEKSYSYKEDRSEWIPRTRLNEQGTRLTAAEQRAVAAEAALALERQRVQALSGVNPVKPEEAQAAEIKEAILKLFPGIKHLETLTAEQLQDVLDSGKASKSAISQTHERHAQVMLADLETAVAKSLKADKLTPTQARRLQQAYREEAFLSIQERQAAVQRGERAGTDTQRGDTDFLARHERGDKTLIAEFAKAFLDDWFTPAQRAAASSNLQRNSRPLPRGERTRQQPAAGEQPVDLNNADAFKKAILQARNAGAQQ